MLCIKRVYAVHMFDNIDWWKRIYNGHKFTNRKVHVPVYSCVNPVRYENRIGGSRRARMLQRGHCGRVCPVEVSPAVSLPVSADTPRVRKLYHLSLVQLLEPGLLLCYDCWPTTLISVLKGRHAAKMFGLFRVWVTVLEVWPRYRCARSIILGRKWSIIATESFTSTEVKV